MPTIDDLYRNVIEAADRFRSVLLREDAKSLTRLLDAYAAGYAKLQDKIDLLIIQMAEETATKGQILRWTRYRQLQEQITAELSNYQTFARFELDGAVSSALNMGGTHARQMMAISLGDPALAAAFNTLPKDAVITMLGFLQEDSPLYQRIQMISPATAQYVEDKLIEGITLGYNPRKIGRMLADAYGRGLTDSLRMVRTAQLWAYRESSRANYAANADILDGWVWHAKLDGLTCMSCVAQHGSVHPLDEPLNDHYNGRCAPLPITKLFGAPVQQTGPEWFDTLTPEDQQQMMGKGKHEAWTDGRFALSQLSVSRTDAIYGNMRTEATLKELIPAE